MGEWGEWPTSTQDRLGVGLPPWSPQRTTGHSITITSHRTQPYNRPRGAPNPQNHLFDCICFAGSIPCLIYFSARLPPPMASFLDDILAPPWGSPGCVPPSLRTALRLHQRGTAPLDRRTPHNRPQSRRHRDEPSPRLRPVAAPRPRTGIHPAPPEGSPPSVHFPGQGESHPVVGPGIFKGFPPRPTRSFLA